MAPDELDARLRLAMFAHLDRVSAAHPDGLPSNVINSFSFEGRAMRLIVQPGIRKPADLSAALTIRTTYTPPGGQAPYEDELGADGSFHRDRDRDDQPQPPTHRHAPILPSRAGRPARTSPIRMLPGLSISAAVAGCPSHSRTPGKP